MNSDSEDLENSLEPGVWIEMMYGFNLCQFCVLEKKENAVKICKSSWLVSGSHFETINLLKCKNAKIIGRGKHRWWRLFLPYINDCIFPYSKPRALIYE